MTDSNLLASCIKVGGQEICDNFPTAAASGSTTAATNSFVTVGDVISRIMEYAFPVAGIILFVVLVSAGFDYMGSAGEPKKIGEAWKKITYSLAGFGLLLVSFFIVRTVARILGFDSPI